MGLVSLSGIGNAAKAVWHYGKAAVRNYPSLVFGKGLEQGATTLVSGIKANQGVKDVFTATKASVKTQLAKEAANGGFFKQAWQALKTTPRTISVYARKGALEAGLKGGSKLGKFWGGVKGTLKGIGKKMPLIGNILLVASYLPNIVSATKEQGIGQGVIETGKSAVKLGGAAAGAAIGTAVAGPIGSIVGWIAGEWLAGKIVGKDYTTKKAEAEEQAQEQLAQMQQMQPQVAVNPVQGGTANPFMSNPNSYNYGLNYGMNDYSNDIMMQNMKFNTLA